MVRARAIAYIELACSVPKDVNFLSFYFIDRENKYAKFSVYAIFFFIYDVTELYDLS
jgi:hypothetical protein